MTNRGKADLSRRTFLSAVAAAASVAPAHAALEAPLDPPEHSFTQAGTGAVTRSWHSKLRDTVSVFDFMTTAQIADVQAGTHVLDVTNAFQAAITAANTSSRLGGMVSVPKGNYKITSSLILSPSGSRVSPLLIGECMDGVRLSWFGGNSACVALNGRTRGLRIENIEIHNMGRVGTSIGISFNGDTTGTNHSSGLLNQVRVNGFNEGLKLGDLSSHAASEMEFRNCTFTNCTDGVVIRDMQSVNLWFYGCNAATNANGLHVVNASSVYWIGGSVGTNATDFHMEQGAAEWCIEKVHSENSARFCTIGPSAGAGSATTGCFTIRDCVVNNTLSADNRAIRIHQGGQITIENNRLLEGHIFLNTGANARTALHVVGNNITDQVFIENGDVASAYTIIYQFGNKSNTTVFLKDQIRWWRDNATSGIYWSREGIGQLSDVILGSLNYLEGYEITAPSAPIANGYRIFGRDNGAGKTQLCVRFPTGATQVIATEP